LRYTIRTLAGVILAAVSSLTFSFQEKFPIFEGALKSPEIRLL
jgi:hypothetical protein